MPYKEKEIEKLFYSIGEAANMLSISSSMIRFWEKEFPQLKPRKGLSGVRQYNVQDLETLRKIHFLVKTKGFTLEGAKKALQDTDLRREYEKEEILESLQEIRNRLLHYAEQ